MIEVVLGEGSVKKINDQRKKDGYKEMDSSVALSMLCGITGAYSQVYAKQVFEPLTKTIDDINRQTKKYYNRGKRRYGRY